MTAPTPFSLTARASVVAARMVELLTAYIDDTAFNDPPIRGVCYGDQDKLPITPWVCVEPNDKIRDWPPTPTDMTEVTIEVQMLLYYSDGDKSEEERRKITDRLAETIEEYFNVNHRQLTDAYGNQLVIYGYCVSVESAVAQKGLNSLYKAVRIIWRGRSKLRLTQAQ